MVEMKMSNVTLSGTIEGADGEYYAVLKAGPFSTSKEADGATAAMFARINEILTQIKSRQDDAVKAAADEVAVS
jgi:hypothetical protein